jgi:hypothetical protein
MNADLACRNCGQPPHSGPPRCPYCPELACIECGTAPEYGYLPDPTVLRCPVCGSEDSELVRTPTDEEERADMLATFWTVAEVDQLQAEATRQGRPLTEVMAADTFMDWKLDGLLAQEPPDYLDPSTGP